MEVTYYHLSHRQPWKSTSPVQYSTSEPRRPNFSKLDYSLFYSPTHHAFTCGDEFGLGRFPLPLAIKFHRGSELWICPVAIAPACCKEYYCIISKKCKIMDRMNKRSSLSRSSQLCDQAGGHQKNPQNIYSRLIDTN